MMQLTKLEGSEVLMYSVDNISPVSRAVTYSNTTKSLDSVLVIEADYVPTKVHQSM